MEEAEKRGERLKAMCLEAAQIEVFCSVDISTTKGCLSNPLIEPYSTPLTKENSLSVPRFDYYTDPMSAFSGNKRRRSSLQMPQDDVFPSISSGSPVARVSSYLSGTRSPYMFSSPAHQLQTSYSPDRKTYETNMVLHGSDSWGSPGGMASPFLGHQGTPGAYNRYAGVSGYSYSFPFNSSRSGGIPSPCLRRGDSSSSGSGKGSSFRSGNGSGWRGSGNPSSGRGRHYRFYKSPSNGSGRDRGRGWSFHSYVSAQDRPELFYSKSMIDDPWKFLKPMIWR